MIATTSIFDQNIDDIVESQASCSSHTRQVSSTAPACIIRSCWYKHYPQNDLEVTIEYLKSVCDCIFPKLEPRINSLLGSMLSKHIDTYEHNSDIDNHMMMVLYSGQDVVLSEGRNAIIRTLK